MVVISQDNTHTNRYIHLHYLKTSAPETEFNYTITWQYIILSIWLSVYSYISVCCGNFLREFRFAEVILPWKYVSSNETRWTATNNSIYSYLTNLNVEGLNLSVELAIRWGLIFLIFVGQTGGTWRKCCKSNHKPKQTLSLAPSLSLSPSLSPSRVCLLNKWRFPKLGGTSKSSESSGKIVKNHWPEIRLVLG